MWFLQFWSSEVRWSPSSPLICTEPSKYSLRETPVPVGKSWWTGFSICCCSVRLLIYSANRRLHNSFWSPCSSGLSVSLLQYPGSGQWLFHDLLLCVLQAWRPFHVVMGNETHSPDSSYFPPTSHLILWYLSACPHQRMQPPGWIRTMSLLVIVHICV